MKVMRRHSLAKRMEGGAILILLFLLLGILTSWIDSTERGIGIVGAVVLILVMMGLAILVVRINTIITPFKDLECDKNGLVLSGKSDLKIAYSWGDIRKIHILNKELKLFLVLVKSSGDNEEFELMEKWLFSELNSTKTVKYNHEKLMNCCGLREEFRELVDFDDYINLLVRFDIPAPDWFLKKIIANSNRL